MTKFSLKYYFSIPAVFLLLFLATGSAYRGFEEFIEIIEHGNYQTAVIEINKSIDLMKKRKGRKYLERISGKLHDLAVIYSVLGNFELAEKAYIESLELKKEVLGDNHISVDSHMKELAMYYRSQGKYDRALDYLIQSIAIRKEDVKEWPGDGNIIGNLSEGLYEMALLQLEQGEYEQAEKQFNQALVLRNKVLASLITDKIYRMLGILYRIQGDFAKAEHFFNLAIRNMGHEGIYPHVYSLAESYRLQGKYDLAEKIYIDKLRRMFLRYGQHHPAVADSLDKLALIYRSRGNDRLAEKLTQHVEVIRESLNVTKTYSSLDRFEYLDTLFQAEEKEANVVNLLSGIKAAEKNFGVDHQYLQRPLNKLGKIYIRRGQYNKAEKLYRRVMNITKMEALSDQKKNKIYSNLANSYFLQNKFSEAEPLLRRLLLSEQGRGSYYHYPSEITSSILNRLAICYHVLGQYAEAEDFYQQSLAIDLKRLGQDHPQVAFILEGLAALYRATNRKDEAEPLEQRAARIKRFHQ